MPELALGSSAASPVWFQYCHVITPVSWDLVIVF
jgi:hypothetical protein